MAGQNAKTCPLTRESHPSCPSGHNTESHCKQKLFCRQTRHDLLFPCTSHGNIRHSITLDMFSLLLNHWGLQLFVCFLFICFYLTKKSCSFLFMLLIVLWNCNFLLVKEIRIRDILPDWLLNSFWSCVVLLANLLVMTQFRWNFTSSDWWSHTDSGNSGIQSSWSTQSLQGFQDLWVESSSPFHHCA